MKKIGEISRRNFIEKMSLINGSLILMPAWLSACDDSDWDYLPVQGDNPAIARWAKKCEECGDCVEACASTQKVWGTYPASKTKHVCIHCGTCITNCEEGALTEKYQWQEILQAIDDPSKIVIASIAPSVRVGIGEFFGMTAGLFLDHNLVGSCRALGFDHILDTNFCADLTIMEEAAELQKRIETGLHLPQFTSCCPAWVKYVEIYYPSLLNHISTIKSPISMQGALIKSYFSQKQGIPPENIVHVAITPCSAKKFEITRDELIEDGLRSTDIAITTNELATMLKHRGIDLESHTGNFDTLMSSASGGGIIFGSTGGVMTAAIRTAYFNMTGTNPPSNLMTLRDLQEVSGLKEATVTIGSTALNVAVCYEMRNARALLEQVKKGTCGYDFIEVMACRGGCVGGAGQPGSKQEIEKRIAALNTADGQAATRFSHENTDVQAVYRDFLGTVGGSKARKYLHTSYINKSRLL